MATRTRQQSTNLKTPSSDTSTRKFEQRLVHLEQMLEHISETIKKGDQQPSRNGTCNKDEDHSFCNLPIVTERQFNPNVSSDRAELIRYNDKKWVNGTTLKYWFFNRTGLKGHPSNVEIVRDAFLVWEDVGIGIAFEEVDDIRDADIRVGFKHGDGAWSYLGRDVIDIPGKNERTMNFGWDLRQDSRGIDTPVHEIGHTLGFPHEHQNPFSGIIWDEEAVYSYFAGHPNYWEREKTYRNVLRKLSSRDVEGSPWDPNSIMHYGFKKGLIIEPAVYQNGLSPSPSLSDFDKAEVRKFYPKTEAHISIPLPLLQSVDLDISATEQRNFLIEPDSTRKYQIRAFGQSDVLMVLFRQEENGEKYITGSDDSGTQDNAEMTVRLDANQKYILRVRLFSQYGNGGSAIMYW